MSPEAVKEVVGDLPWMSLPQARTMTAFIREHRLQEILELGFYSGVSTCYLAAAIEDLSSGAVTTIDLEKARAHRPNIEELLEKTGLRQRVRIFYEPSSYTWRLMRFLEEDPAPRFDFCYLDGAHQWAVDGFAFFLVDRLLRPGGWIVFDDLDWNVADCPVNRDSEWARRLPPEERNTAQIRKVYELLVKTHPSYTEFRVEAGMAYARKRPAAVWEPKAIQREVEVKWVPVPEGRFRAFLRAGQRRSVQPGPTEGRTQT